MIAGLFNPMLAGENGFPEPSGVVQTASVTTATFTANLPPSVANDLIMVLIVGGVNQAPVAAGWTALQTGTTLAVLYKFAGGSEGTSVSISGNTGGNGVRTIAWVFKGCDTAKNPEGTTQVTGTTSTSVDPPAVTPTWGTAKTLWMTFLRGTVTSGTTIAWNGQYNVAPSLSGTTLIMGGVGAKKQVSSEDPPAGTLSLAPSNTRCTTVAIKGLG